MNIQKLIGDQKSRLLRQKQPTVDLEPEEPEYLRGLWRGLTVIDHPPESIKQPRPSVDEARRMVQDAIFSYFLEDDPQEMLLVKAVPGIGKTTVAVFAAELLAEQGRRVLYAGPRHDFFMDVLAMADHPDWWYEWLPRQEGDDIKKETCRYTVPITTWMTRGYEAMEFCKRVCGWDYITNRCPYHAQKRCKKPIIFGQHQHVTLGHPMEFGVVIGDECPVPAFCDEWHIPTRWIMPPGMNMSDPLTEMLRILQSSVPKEGAVPGQITGESLLALLGTPDEVLGACESMVIPADAAFVSPDIYSPEQVDEVPYAHLPQLIALLKREARMARENRKYPHRIILDSSGLTLLLRHEPSERLPRHVVWLDATANETLYHACFQREVRLIDAQPELMATIFQVHSRANGKATLLDKGGEPTNKVDQIEQQVRRILQLGKYEGPTVVSFEGLFRHSEVLDALDHLHFYAARGTNALQDADAIIVAGTPQPPISSIEYMARMIFFERDTAFRTEWSTKECPYRYLDPDDGKGRAYPVSGFWGDPELNAVLWSLREAEIIQAAHRSRPINHPVDIWLLTNVPLDELPPTKLMDVRELFDAPEGVNPFLWYRALQIAERCDRENGLVTVDDLVAGGILRDTAYTYLHRLHEEMGWLIESVRRDGKGRPKLGVRREA